MNPSLSSLNGCAQGEPSDHRYAPKAVGATVWQASPSSSRTGLHGTTSACCTLSRALLFATVQLALEFAHDSSKVPVHRRTGPVGIARLDRRQDRGVIANCLARELRRMKMTLRSAPEFRALIP